uniref:Uncharacterized protein n=1 Tax=Arundo donax TaxID=35708 RepID=A0A0A9E611_ARUDO
MEALECMIKRICTKEQKYFTGGACQLPNLEQVMYAAYQQ